MVEVQAEVAKGPLFEAVFEGKVVVGGIGVEGPVDAGNSCGHDIGVGSCKSSQAGGAKVVVVGLGDGDILLHPGLCL